MSDNPQGTPTSSVAQAGTIWGIDPDDLNRAIAVFVNHLGQLQTSDGQLEKAIDQFNEIRVTERTPVIELSSKYGFSKLRDLDKSVNGGSITFAAGEFLVATSTDIASEAIFESAAIGRYMPGYASEIGIGIRMTGDTPTGNQDIYWGGVSEDEGEGLFFGMDATGMYVEILRETTATKVYRDNWNIDKLDGTGPSQYTLDTSLGHIYQVVYTWYGYGQITWNVLATVNGRQQVLPVHQESGFAQTSIRDPNLRLAAEVKNNGEASSVGLYVAGRQYSILGKYIPKYRFTSEWVRAVDTSGTTFATPIPIISYRRDPAKIDKATSIELDTVQASGTLDDHLIEIYYGGSLTGVAWDTPDGYDPNETIVESDTSATAVDLTDAILIYRELILEGDRKTESFTEKNFAFDLPASGLLTMTVRPYTNGGEVNAGLRIKEEW